MAVLLGVLFGLPGWAHAQPQERFPLTAQLIAKTLSDQGMHIAESQVSLLAKVVATETHPILDIMSVASLGKRWSQGNSESHSLVKIGCHQPGTCLPFYAIVNWPEETVKASGVVALPGSASAWPKAIPVMTMRAGTHAMLEMDDERSHVQVSVISLQSGNTGDRIRVASPDRKQTYTAEVVSTNLLKRSY
jgi:hypothetical protein